MNTFCEKCGAPLSPTARFCPKCGQPVQAAVGQSSQPESYPPVPPPLEITPPADDLAQPPPRSKRTWWVAVIALVVAACCGLLVCIAGAVMLYNRGQDSPIGQVEIPVVSTSFPLPPTPAPTLEAPLPPTQPAVQAATQPASPSGLQKLSDTEFFDDFSSAQLNWYQHSDDQNQVGYENGAYAMQVKVPDYRALVRPPVQYLTHLEFDAQVVEGADNGTFGVACYYQDFSNYYFVDFDMARREYHFGRITDGKWEELSEWSSFAGFPEPLGYAVDCTPGLMSLYINDQLVAEIPVSLPVEPHEMWLVVMSWAEAGPGGIKVLFDDLYGYRAMQ